MSAVTKISNPELDHYLQCSLWGELTKYQMTAVVLLKTEINLQLPPSPAPFGISKYSGKYSLSVSLDDDTQTRLEEIDAWLREAIVSNPTWLGKARVSEDQLDLLYTPLVRAPPKSTYASTIKVPLKIENGRPVGFVYETGKDTPETDLSPGSHARSSAQINFSLRGLWVSSGRCGPLLALRRVRFEEGVSNITDQMQVLQFA